MEAGEAFGLTESSEIVTRHTLSAGGLTARILDWGAIVQDLRLEGHAEPLVLGFDRFDDYPVHSRYFGAIVGRNANRLRDGRFVLDGERYEVDGTPHALHGGRQGLHDRLWRTVAVGEDFVSLALTDPHDPEGFPGTIEISCTYRIRRPATLVIELQAASDRPTLCNLAHHSYFNLDNGGSGDILDHRLAIAASAYLPVDHELVPTGHVVPVERTPYDFLLPRPIRLEWEAEVMSYDHNFCLASSRGPMRRAAWLQGTRSGVEMELWTTEPGLQFFDGNFTQIGARGLGGRTYAPRAGLCLEPQMWPDAPNWPHFPQTALWPGEIYRQVSEYRFRLPQEV